MARPADPHARASLIAAARAEFVKSGILKARIEDITVACGLSKGAFYLHFESKEALFRELAQALEREFERLRAEREQASLAFLEAHVGSDGLPRHDADFARRLLEFGAREDRQLFELLWTWRDVLDVLLRGCQGTEFDGVMWQLLDRQLEQVRRDCRNLQRVRLMRDDVEPDVLSMMVVGTYLVIARRLVRAEEKPDFARLVEGLQRVMFQGVGPPTSSASRAAAQAPPASAPRLPTRLSRLSRLSKRGRVIQRRRVTKSAKSSTSAKSSKSSKKGSP